MFITFEGMDGCGKSTHCSLLHDRLEAKGKKVFSTHEPGDGGEIGEKIRDLILAEEMKSMDPLAELFLFCADRVHHVEKVLKPRLKCFDVVISDRFSDSTVAYQGYGRGIDLEFVKLAARLSALNLKPDLTFFLDVPGEVCIQRLKGRESHGKPANRMDRETEMFYGRLRAGFMREAEKDPERIKIIDARGSVESTHSLIVRAFEGRFGI